jgi:hypothetical protein
MTISYDINTDTGKVRLLISDTSLTTPHFTDEEIQAFLTMYPGSYRLPAAQALEAWATGLSQNADSERIGDYSYTKKQVTYMLALAERLRNDENTQPVMDWAEMDFVDFGEVEGVEHFY